MENLDYDEKVGRFIPHPGMIIVIVAQVSWKRELIKLVHSRSSPEDAALLSRVINGLVSSRLVSSHHPRSHLLARARAC